ncbi:MAG TPA: response regulator [Edaphobacter sp.]|nr:response regulator [Edaphobacter sp.]
MLTFFILGFAVLLCVGIFLLVGFLHARRDARSLAEQLTQAREQHHQQHRQITERSQLDTLKDEFISTVSHELRTPLTSIRGALGLLSSGAIGEVDAKALNLLRIATVNTDRLIRLINDILDIERMDSGRAALQIRRCSLRDLCHQAIETMAPMASTNGIHLELDSTTTPEGLFFDGDPDRLLQVLTNLLSNAIKFSPSGTTVHVQTESMPDSLLLKVCDEGRGIPADKLDSIFERFHQVEPSDARQKGGTGLGLAISRSIVQQHSGSIWAQRNTGPGTTFYVMLPRVTRASDLVLPSEPSTASQNNAIVLICDDDPGIRTVIAEHLQRQGYAVIEAVSGEQALTLAANNPVEVILLDLYMPGLSGWETLQHLRNNPATAHIPVVVLSVLSSTLRPQLTGVAQGWVQKPFNETALFAELGRVLHPGGGPANVLLVEDDIDLANVVMASFQSGAVRVEHAATRQQAIVHCVTNPPDLLILDLTLPDGDGFTLVEWLREQPALRSLPLVVYSGREISDHEMSMLRLGPTEFLTKAKVQPHEVEELVVSMVRRIRSGLSDLVIAGPAD